MLRVSRSRGQPVQQGDESVKILFWVLGKPLRPFWDHTGLIETSAEGAEMHMLRVSISRIKQ